METIQPEQLSLKEAQEILGDLPIDMAALSQGYSCLIEEAVKDKKFTFEYKKTLSSAYRKLAEGVCEFQIEKDGEFKTVVDFSSLNGVVVFPNQPITGVNVCNACSGLGERIKFYKKPLTVQCLKCKSQSYILNGEEITVDDEIILVNGENKTAELKYNRLIGRVVEDCLSCKGTGRYITESYIFNGEEIRIEGNEIFVNNIHKTHDPKYRELLDDYIGFNSSCESVIKPKKDHLRINVECKTCHGMKYNPDNEKTQILIKCKTCKGTKLVKIMVLSPSVDTTTRCGVCRGLGFIRPNYRPDNPVLTRSLAATIKSL